jgi:hypothetical protein
MNVYLRSILLTLLVGAVLGTSIAYIGSLSYTKSIVGTVLGQFIFFAFYNRYRARKDAAAFTAEMTTRIKEFSKQGIDTECAFCTAPQFVPIRFDRDNEFECTECGKTSALYITVTSAQKTKPLDVSPLRVNTIISEEMEAREKIKQSG